MWRNNHGEEHSAMVNLQPLAITILLLYVSILWNFWTFSVTCLLSRFTSLPCLSLVVTQETSIPIQIWQIEMIFLSTRFLQDCGWSGNLLESKLFSSNLFTCLNTILLPVGLRYRVRRMVQQYLTGNFGFLLDTMEMPGWTTCGLFPSFQYATSDVFGHLWTCFNF